MTLNGRERTTRAIEMNGPDRPPLMHVALPGALRRHGQALLDLYARYPADIVLVGETGSGEFSGTAGVRSTDAWGSVWVSATDDHKGLVEAPLLPDWNAFATFAAPVPAVTVADLEQGHQALAGAAGKYVLVDGDTLWQRMFYLRGFENALADLVLEPERAATLRDMILEFMLERIRVWSQLPVDGFMVRDDWGTQESLMIAPDLWRRFFRPAYARIGDLIHSLGRHYWFHSDGDIRAIIPDLLDAGVDVLNPQENVVGLRWLEREIGGQACVLGDVDRQWLLPFGTPEGVAQATRASIEALGRFRGGYIVRAEAAADVPLESVEAVLRAVYRPGP